MKVKQMYWRGILLGLVFAAAVPMGGCKASCDTDNGVEDVVEEVGDEIEDATD